MRNYFFNNPNESISCACIIFLFKIYILKHFCTIFHTFTTFIIHTIELYNSAPPPTLSPSDLASQAIYCDLKRDDLQHLGTIYKRSQSMPNTPYPNSPNLQIPNTFRLQYNHLRITMFVLKLIYRMISLFNIESISSISIFVLSIAPS